MAAIAYEAMTFAVEDGVGVITLNRPEALNALDLQLKDELADALRRITDDSAVRCLVVTGAGRAFCAGGDITEMDPERAPEETRRRMLKLLRDVYIPLARLEKPVIAAVNGHAHGAGLSLAMACDLIYAKRDATFSFAFARMGLIPDSGALFFLPRRVGVPRAKELVFSARRFDPEEALALGIVQRVVDEDVLEAALDQAGAFARMPALQLGMAKRLLDQSPLIALEDMAELEAYSQAVAVSTADHAEAVDAFLHKRTPVFGGGR
jgi:2-(1,2-epoxy-1,2-dihydrophenyl)acetyl-CoA isomerase